MADGDKKGSANDRIDDKKRYQYIGFEVFPGQPKDLFKNDSEKQKLVDGVLSKRESDETLRDDCKLMEERVSFGERIIMAVASVAILAALMLPWYSAYMEVEIEAEPVAEEVTDSASMALVMGDSLAMSDTLAGLAAVTDETLVDSAALLAEEAAALAAARLEANQAAGVTTHAGERANEQIITAHMARTSTEKVYTQLSGLGVFAALGSVGSPVFSSGFVLLITGVLMLVYGLLCVGLPILNLYGIFGLKGKPDDIALKLKQYLKLNWLLLILFTVVLILSFFGADYGFDSSESFTSFGGAYGVGVFLESLSWGVYVALAASLLVAVKGIEI